MSVPETARLTWRDFIDHDLARLRALGPDQARTRYVALWRAWDGRGPLLLAGLAEGEQALRGEVRSAFGAEFERRCRIVRVDALMSEVYG